MTVFWQIIGVFVVGLVAILTRLPMGLPFFVRDIVLGWLFYILIAILTLYVIWSFLFFLSLAVRRIHDIGLCGWWLLIGLVPSLGLIVVFIFTLIAGHAGDNKFGPDPRGLTVVPPLTRG